MSASLNTVAGTIYEDFLQFVLKDKKVTEKQHNFVIKLIVLVLGLVCIALVFIVERLGTLYQMTMSLNGLTYGTLFGVFSLGMFCPRANAKGAIWGTVSSLLVMTVIVTGTQYYTSQGLLKFPGKVTSVDGCPSDLIASLPFNASDRVQTYRGVGSPVIADDSVPLIFQLTYMYYALVGTLLVFLVALPVSYCTEKPSPSCLDPKLFSPPVRRFLPKASVEVADRHNAKSGEYSLVQTSEPNGDLKISPEENRTTIA